MLFRRRALALVDKGLTREQAYDLVQKAAMEVWQEGGKFRAVLEEQTELAGILSASELDAIFSHHRLLARVDLLLARAGIKDGDNA